MRRMRRALVLLGLVPVLMGAEFPGAIYDHVTKNATCTAVPSDCGVGSEATCSGAGQPCLYTATKMNNVADEVEAIETALGVNLANVLEPTDIDTSAELAAILTNETGTGAACFATGPTLSGPVLAASTVAGLPTAGSRVGAVYVVTDSASGTCTSGGGSTLILCRDGGASYDALSGGSSGGGNGTFQVCRELLSDPLADNEELYFWPAAVRLIAAGCRCAGTCTTPATFAFETQAGAAIGLTGGGALSCSTGGSGVTYVTFNTADDDRLLDAGDVLRFDTTNTPGTSDPVKVCVTFAYQ